MIERKTNISSVSKNFQLSEAEYRVQGRQRCSNPVMGPLPRAKVTQRKFVKVSNFLIVNLQKLSYFLFIY